MFPLRRPSLVPPIFWQRTFLLRVWFVVVFLIPAVVGMCGAIFDIFQLAGRGSVPNDHGYFMFVTAATGRRTPYLPTMLTWSIAAIALIGAIGFFASYARLKRRVYHEVWKRKFCVCLTCYGGLPSNPRLRVCTQCDASLPKIGVEKAWKEWYDSTWDEFTWSVDHEDWPRDRFYGYRL
ncbi:MAG: hypothetical protein AB7N71_00550 [Phycisphaerae bacterium]